DRQVLRRAELSRRWNDLDVEVLLVGDDHGFVAEVAERHRVEPHRVPPRGWNLTFYGTERLIESASDDKRETPSMRSLSICAALAAAVVIAMPARASELSEIKDTQKKILDRLDEQDKVLKDIQTKVQAL